MPESNRLLDTPASLGSFQAFLGCSISYQLDDAFRRVLDSLLYLRVSAAKKKQKSPHKTHRRAAAKPRQSTQTPTSNVLRPPPPNTTSPKRGTCREFIPICSPVFFNLLLRSYTPTLPVSGRARTMLAIAPPCAPTMSRARRTCSRPVRGNIPAHTGVCVWVED